MERDEGRDDDPILATIVFQIYQVNNYATMIDLIIANIPGVKQEGLTEDQMKNLKIIPYKELNISSYNTCPICLEPYQDDDEVHQIESCQHLFHSQCLLSWCKGHNTCPLCRHAVVVKDN